MAARDKKGSVGKKAAPSPVPMHEASVPAVPLGAEEQLAPQPVSETIGGPETLQPAKKANAKKTKRDDVSSETGSVTSGLEPTAQESAQKSATPTKPKKVVKKKSNQLAIELKAKNKKPNKKLNISKAVLKAELKNKTELIKNGTKLRNIRKITAKQAPAAISMSESTSAPPENVAPAEENSDGAKKDTKKRAKKAQNETADNPVSEETVDKEETIKIKKEKEDYNEYDAKNELDGVAVSTPKKNVKKTVKKRNGGGDGVRKEMSIIEWLNIKPRGKSPKGRNVSKVVTPAMRMPRKVKLIDRQSRAIVDSIAKETDIDSDAQNVINSLDLNVSKIAKLKTDGEKRRHSIEKIVPDVDSDNSCVPDFTQYTNAQPRSLSPKLNKRTSKVRQSVDVALSQSRNRSPYSTRSESPARILRNGKHRKLKDLQLLDGIESEYKKRRRILSDSRDGSELSKNSGYLSESDSSFCESTVSALENPLDVDSFKESQLNSELSLIRPDIFRPDVMDSFEMPSPSNIKDKIAGADETATTGASFKSLTDKIKRSLSTETTSNPEDSPINVDGVPAEKDGIDTVNNNTNRNSGPLMKENEIKKEIPDTVSENCPVKLEEPSNAAAASPPPSVKLSERNMILDQMAQNFNDVPENDPEWGKRTTRASWRRTVNKDSPASDKKATDADTVPVKKFYGESVTESLENNQFVSERANSESEKESDVDNSSILNNEQAISSDNTLENNITIGNKTIDGSVGSTTDETLETVDGGHCAKDVGLSVAPPEMTKEVKDEATEGNVKEIDTKKDSECKDKKENDDAVLENNNKNRTANVVIDKSAANDEIDFDDDSTRSPIQIECNENSNDDGASVKSNSSVIKIDINSTPIIINKLPLTDILLKKIETNEQSLDFETLPMFVPQRRIENEPAADANAESATPGRAPKDLLKESPTQRAVIEETPENQRTKESVLGALGLQTLSAHEKTKLALAAAKTKRNQSGKTGDSSSGTLKTVIKINRTSSEKRKKGQLKMTFQKKSRRKDADIDGDGFYRSSNSPNGEYYKIMKEASSSGLWQTSGQSSDTAGANRKSHYSSNRSNTDGSSEPMSDDGGNGTAVGENSGTTGGDSMILVIPEKASSFSIHPDRLCRDECCYCTGKFGLFDTPCHIAQIKSVERQQKILEIEKHLTAESCLCDACYRHVDRKANTPSYNKNYKRSGSIRPNTCHAIGCPRDATHTVRRKWIMKMKRNLHQHVQIDLDNPGLHSIPVCSTHYTSIERLMVCAMCKRRLARNHVHYVGPEYIELNVALEQEGIPVRLTERPVVCKLCRYFATLLLKPPSEGRAHTISFFKSYKKRLLHFHDIEVMDDAEAEEPIPVPTKEKPDKEKHLKKSKKSKLSKSKHENNAASDSSANSASSSCNNVPAQDSEPVEKNAGRQQQTVTGETTSRVPLNNNSDTIKMDANKSEPASPADESSAADAGAPNVPVQCDNDTELINSVSKSTKVPDNTTVFVRKLQSDSQYVVEISKVPKEKKSAAGGNAVERLETNPSISVRQLFPGEDDLPLQGSVDFANVKERTPEGWEKCSTTVQYDHDTKRLWFELQKPYGNQSSFLRHLILLEKYFRNGDLVLTPNASHHATNYCESVQNRLRAYDNIPSHGYPMKPLSMLPFNAPPQQNATPARRLSNHNISQSGIITTKQPSPNITVNAPKGTNTSVAVSQLGPNFVTPINVVRQRFQSVPPGLISLTNQQAASVRPPPPPPASSLIRLTNNKKPQIGRVTKQWKPTLIPINQSKASATVTSGELNKSADGKVVPNLVQVMSGGKPYHISVQDYNRMCLIKRENDLRRKKLMEQSTQKVNATNPTSATASGGTPPGNSVLKPNIVRKPSVVGGVPSASGSSRTSPVLSPAETANKQSTESFVGEQQQLQQKKPVMILPKIPKSLTVIPQTIRRPSDSSSPNLLAPKPALSKTS